MSNQVDSRTLELYSSALTLSDMEVFIFPELLYANVLANLLSPRIWEWKQDPWFAGIENLGFERQIQRLKQYIMDHYSFNLDLETWGLTTKERELERFSPFVDQATLAKSNALFGYEGDKYYYDMDIRKHFGLDQYTTNIIPYWKTETIEAMDAFRFKPGYRHGAGECVSLSTLYAAAAYIVLGVPLEDIFLMATPLHSQTFLARGQGVITNNRRIVTKTMWFNGSELSSKARRALEKERITIVAHNSGHIHIDADEATIAPEAYARFAQNLRSYLGTSIDFEIFANFLRVHEEFRKYFEFEYSQEGHVYYLDAEVLYRYEHGSKCRVGDSSRKKLLAEVEMEEFRLHSDSARCRINVLEEKLNGQPMTCKAENTYSVLKQMLANIPEVDVLCAQLRDFACTQPRLPDAGKKYKPVAPIVLPAKATREQVAEVLGHLRASHRTVDLAFLAYRQIDSALGWESYFKAALERNPVSVQGFAAAAEEQIYRILLGWPAESIYSGDRLALPDEVFNYQRGDGFEKAVCLLNVLKQRHPQASISLEAGLNETSVGLDGQSYRFPGQKQVNFSQRKF